MTQFVVILFFIACHTVPNGVKNFEIQVYPSDKDQEMILFFDYQEEKGAWSAYPKGEEEDRGLVKVDAEKFYLLEPEVAEFEIQELLLIQGNENWKKMKEVSLVKKGGKEGEPGPQSPILINRLKKEKKVVLNQEKGELAELGRMEIRWE